ncbi:dynein light chain Tctex-type protein 2 [Hypomesus transpacificus]|uniref:dynein light chain Tctex-type protein 2 n=1 Tax=Hypomesus transpacificus TaxID=137520 RepID=UPI001F0882C4|nr:dynein light chain Tctex-type protein 2 [Hypomesus transpacificus]
MSGGRRMSIAKGFRKDSYADRPRGSNVDVDPYDDDDTNQLKRGSSVWKSGFKGKLGNTYRLGPKVQFLPHLIRKKGTELMSQAFGELIYEHDKCRDVADKVAADILAFTKEQVCDRYRYVVRVIVGEKRGQTVKIASRALWDAEKDNFLTLNFENQHLFAVGMVFGIYLE